MRVFYAVTLLLVISAACMAVPGMPLEVKILAFFSGFVGLIGFLSIGAVFLADPESRHQDGDQNTGKAPPPLAA